MADHHAADWKLGTPAARLSGHVFVSLTAADPDYPANVTYALFAVRATASGAVVDAATLLLSMQGG
ncbi:MAG TPA: hypothetical protein VFG83_15080 [Kofleriaceae bacterium]|nr:hypothetical protein [Kofleriaceae bacterium]